MSKDENNEGFPPVEVCGCGCGAMVVCAVIESFELVVNRLEPELTMVRFTMADGSRVHMAISTQQMPQIAANYAQFADTLKEAGVFETLREREENKNSANDNRSTIH